MDLNSVLAQFGLGFKEDDVYLALLELGTSSVAKIAKKAGIKRTTVYDVLNGLEKKGLVGQTVKGKKRLFYAEEPEKLGKLLDEKKEMLEEALPQLKSIYNTAGSKPKIRYYEGKEGLKEVYRDTLSHDGELQAFASENIVKYLGEDFASEYMSKRVGVNIFAKVIGPDNEEMQKYKKVDKDGFKKTKLVPEKKFPFTMEMNIYGNRVALMSFSENMGMIIESNEISDNMKLLFDLAWIGAEKKKQKKPISHKTKMV
jgi:HTH-type transcriptional regulator, sugar sensing transcriptional regulator